MSYNPQKIEKKWQKYWEKNKFYQAEDFSKRPKQYILIEFPYISGEGIHVGHCRSYSALDAMARKRRMEGFNVLYPIGWDAFGLPAENFAIKTGKHPRQITDENIKNFKRQLKSLGLSFDWSREIDTSDPQYYKWTQWIFLKLFEKGLAYQAEMPINWCPACKIGLANEEVVGGVCERCGAPVGKKTLKQWMLKITAYADRLLADLEKVDYLEKIKTQQTDWIGRSEGINIDFPVKNKDFNLKIFTKFPETIFGVTFMVVAPEHEIIKKFESEIKNYQEVENYIHKAQAKSDLERMDLAKEKTGVELKDVTIINPVNNEAVPVFVGDFVLASVGTGAVMAVPGHDVRDFEFAQKFNLPIKRVIKSYDGDDSEIDQVEKVIEDGIVINSQFLDGLDAQKKAKEKIKDYLEKKKIGQRTIVYKLRDWVFSRQHYWGEPIPIIHCQKCGAVPVPEKDLPVELPYVEKYQPTGTGESPLANISEWVNVACPECGGAARRETDTMPNWAGSNWYFMRYCDPENDKELADPKKLKYWLPVDWYNGGMEHTTLHLLYSRFWYKFLFDIGVVPQSEPYLKRTSHGMVLAADGRKMSKSFGNVINPDDIVQNYGADTLRCYEMFMGPFDQAIAWNTLGVRGVYRFLGKVWKLVSESAKNKESSPKVIKAIHKLNKKIDEDLEATKFNTLVAAFMEFVNLGLENKKEVGKEVIERMLILLSPLAPHLAEELWEKTGHKKSIFLEKWPKYDLGLIKEETISLVIQINGKVRDKIEVEVDITEERAKELAFSRKIVKNWIEGKGIKKVIFVPGKLINIVI